MGTWQLRTYSRAFSKSMASRSSNIMHIAAVTSSNPHTPWENKNIYFFWVPLARSKALQALSKGQGQHSRPWQNSIRDPPLWRILVPLSDQQFQSYIGVYIHTFWPHSPKNKKVRWGTEIFTCTKTETYIFLSSKVDRTKAGQHIHHLLSI